MKHPNWLSLVAVILVLAMVLCACAPAEQTDGRTTGAGEPTVTAPEADPACDHADSDDDGLCDLCGGDVTILLDLYVFNDLHGVFCDTDSNPGVDELTTYLKNAYADDTAYEILLSSGDMWQGSVESSSNKGELMTRWMNEMGFVSMTLGNHEYDWGSEVIYANAQLAQFPLLGINVVDSNTQQSYCQGSVVVEQGGITVGIIGAIGDCLSSISGEYTDGVEFLQGDTLTELVKAESVALRQAGCDLIVYSIHDGGGSAGNMSYYDESLSDGYVDLVLEAHTHQDYVFVDNYGVYHLQAGGYNSGLGYVRLDCNTVTGSFEIVIVDTLDQSEFADEGLADDPIVAELLAEYFPQDDPYTTVIGVNSKSRSSTVIADTVAQLYLEIGQELWGDSYEIVLGGGFLKCRTPYTLTAGDVTYAQLYSLLPFDNDLVLCRVTGKQLNNIFINARNENYHCAYSADLVVDENATYYIVTDTYTSCYKYNMLQEVARLEDYYARDLLRDYIAQGNWEVVATQITIAQALTCGQALQANATTEEVYQVTGTVVSIDNTTYGNLYIQDENGDRIYIYGLYDAAGHRYDKMDAAPQVGDTITITGSIKRYVNTAYNTDTVEFINAVLK